MVGCRRKTSICSASDRRQIGDRLRQQIDAIIGKGGKPLQVRQRIGFVSEDQVLPPFLTVSQVIDLHRGLFEKWDTESDADHEAGKLPKQVRIATYILVIATFVTVVDYVIQAISLDLHKALGAFISLIVVNCLILGRAEAFASRNTVGRSVMDGLGYIAPDLHASAWLIGVALANRRPAKRSESRRSLVRR